ncbi:helix-turn-helix domain-containing protein [Vallitalea guaymasensis]|uniref:helix-turn-helix domain-containing protein n=1 Tax=Vallitalea guaymasensis TaxID=1185412 RepID=UPI000DE3B2BB|nr:helix-turn-helix domain-containing protein [Vallitalea guaymasensis]
MKGDKGRRATELDKKLFINLFDKGNSIYSISKLTGWSEGTITRWLQAKGKDTSLHTYNCKEIEQYDKLGNIICAYKSIKKAEEATGITSSTICHCLKGETVTAGGYVWKKRKEEI